MMRCIRHHLSDTFYIPQTGTYKEVHSIHFPFYCARNIRLNLDKKKKKKKKVRTSWMTFNIGSIADIFNLKCYQPV